MNWEILRSGLLLALVAWVVVSLWRRTRPRSRSGRRRGGLGTAAVGSVYDLLNEDKRRAIDIIVEERAEERRPEYPDGDLPSLEDPRRTSRKE